jgi:hypothetical protein
MRTSNLNKTTHYPAHQTSNLNQLLEQAAEALALKYKREGSFTNAENVKEYLKLKLGGYDREVFALMLLDNQHQLIHFEELFFGTIDSASVYPRKVVTYHILSRCSKDRAYLRHLRDAKWCHDNLCISCPLLISPEQIKEKGACEVLDDRVYNRNVSISFLQPVWWKYLLPEFQNKQIRFIVNESVAHWWLNQ